MKPGASSEQQPTRESFFAIYWDHVRDVPRACVAALAGFGKHEVARVSAMEWDGLTEPERQRMRRAILFLIECHDLKRAQDRGGGVQGAA